MPARRCRYPGCKKQLSQDNQAAVCATHKHTHYCSCRACLEKRGKPVWLREQEAAEAAAIAACQPPKIPLAELRDDITRLRGVSLRRAPWDPPQSAGPSPETTTQEG